MMGGPQGRTRRDALDRLACWLTAACAVVGYWVYYCNLTSISP